MNDRELIFGLLRCVTKRAEKYADVLIDRYGTALKIGETDIDSLSDALGGDFKTAAYIKISYALISRSVTDRFKFGCKHELEDIEEYFKALLGCLSVETVYIMCIDSSGRVISSDFVGEGSVNFLNVFPRKLVETAVKRKAHSVIVAHNHPGGYASPSEDDETATRFLQSLFISSGIKLQAHYIIGGGFCHAMRLDEI